VLGAAAAALCLAAGGLLIAPSAWGQGALSLEGVTVYSGGGLDVTAVVPLPEVQDGVEPTIEVLDSGGTFLPSSAAAVISDGASMGVVLGPDGDAETSGNPAGAAAATDLLLRLPAGVNATVVAAGNPPVAASGAGDGVAAAVRAMTLVGDTVAGSTALAARAAAEQLAGQTDRPQVMVVYTGGAESQEIPAEDLAADLRAARTAPYVIGLGDGDTYWDTVVSLAGGEVVGTSSAGTSLGALERLGALRAVTFPTDGQGGTVQLRVGDGTRTWTADVPVEAEAAAAGEDESQGWVVPAALALLAAAIIGALGYRGLRASRRRRAGRTDTVPQHQRLGPAEPSLPRREDAPSHARPSPGRRSARPAPEMPASHARPVRRRPERTATAQGNIAAADSDKAAAQGDKESMAAVVSVAAGGVDSRGATPAASQVGTAVDSAAVDRAIVDNAIVDNAIVDNAAVDNPGVVPDQSAVDGLPADRRSAIPAARQPSRSHAAPATGRHSAPADGTGGVRTGPAGFRSLVRQCVESSSEDGGTALLRGLHDLVTAWPTAAPPARLTAALSETLSTVEGRFHRGSLRSNEGEAAISRVLDEIHGYWSERDIAPPECARILRRLDRLVDEAASVKSDAGPARAVADALLTYWATTAKSDADDTLELTLIENSTFWADVGRHAQSQRPSRETARSLRELVARVDEYFRRRANTSRRNAERLRTSLVDLEADLRAVR
jgi:hypothetical protein